MLETELLILIGITGAGILTTAFAILNNSKGFSRLLGSLKPKKSEEQLQAEADARAEAERLKAEQERRKRYGL